MAAVESYYLAIGKASVGRPLAQTIGRIESEDMEGKQKAVLPWKAFEF
jgi:hypothetical protein